MQRDTRTAAMHSSLDALRQSVQQQQVQLQHGGGISRPDITTTADARDQKQQELVQLSLELPITYMPFKFENRRVRIDWRLLHGVDIDKLVSTVSAAWRVHWDECSGKLFSRIEHVMG